MTPRHRELHRLESELVRVAAADARNRPVQECSGQLGWGGALLSQTLRDTKPLEASLNAALARIRSFV